MEPYSKNRNPFKIKVICKRSVEVLYFKANLACCKATACNAGISGMVSQFAKDNNKEKFGSELTAMINENLK